MSGVAPDDRLAAARPEGLTGAARAAMLSRVVATARLEAAGPDLARPSPHGAHPGAARRHRGKLAVAAAVAAVAAAGLSLMHGGGGASRGDDIRLASYRFASPSGYTKSASQTCGPGFLVRYPAGTFHSVQQMFGQVHGNPDEPGIASAANAAGGCISMALVGPYTPGGPDTPTIGGIGGPLGSDGASPQQLQIGPYEAELGSFSLQGWTAQGGRMLPVGASAGSELVLDVTIPVSGGEVDNLVVSSNQLSEKALVATVTEGLG